MQRSVRRPALGPGSLSVRIGVFRGSLFVDVHTVAGLVADIYIPVAVLGDVGEYLAHAVEVAAGTLAQRIGNEGACPLPDAAVGVARSRWMLQAEPMGARPAG